MKTRREQPARNKRGFISVGFVFAAFCGLLFVLHGAQPLAVSGPPLSASFTVVKKAQYRIVRRGEISAPLTVSLRNGQGETISTSATFPSDEQASAPRWRILKARASTADAHLFVQGDFAGELELRLIDEQAPRRKWIATLLFLGALAWFCWANWRMPWARALTLGAAYFLVLLPWHLPATVSFSGDDRYYALTSMSLLARGDWDLDEFGGADPTATFHDDYSVRRGRDGHFYNLYPSGTSVLILPIVSLGEWLNDQFPSLLERAARISELAAKLLSAATVSLLYLVVLGMTGRHGLACILALVFAFATPQLSTHAGGLWSHNSSTFLCTLALGLWVWREGRFAWLSAIPLTLGFVCRPTMLLPGVVFAAALLFRDRKHFLFFALLFATIGAAFVFHSREVWGTILPPYYLGHAGAQENALLPFLGTLFSPNRGLFVFCPVLLFAIAGGTLAWRRPGSHGIYAMATAVVVLEWTVASRNGMWWGGHCYGPRLLCELIPFATVLLVPAWEFIELSRLRRVWFTAGALACVWGLFVQVQALVRPAVHDWNASHNFDTHTERLSDWHDWQILADHGR